MLYEMKVVMTDDVLS